MTDCQRGAVQNRLYSCLPPSFARVRDEIHSTDTHGSNEVNFALLHLFGYQFAPRYKDLYDKVRTSLSGLNIRADMVMQSSGPCERLRSSSSSTNGIMSSALSCPWRSKPQPRAP